MARVAITTMARNLDHTFRDWCSYHLQAVDRILVWLDDPREASSPHLPLDDRVQIRVGSQHRQGSVHGDFMIRQDQNTERSLSLCLKERIDWVIHLDIDELLYPAHHETLRRNLPESAGHVTLLNHEVCPHWHCDNPFRDCNDFKLNGRSRFNLYTNGKAAVRCQPRVYPHDAHSFGGYTGDAVTASDIVILHYACPSYDRWLAKYTALGDFPDLWWDNPEHRITISFHLQSRDIYKRCVCEGSFQPAIDFWSGQVLMPEQLCQLRREGIVSWFAPLQSNR
jgi:hypothetical protein